VRKLKRTVGYIRPSFMVSFLDEAALEDNGEMWRELLARFSSCATWGEAMETNLVDGGTPWLECVLT
jgi:hypothetical protein